MYYEESGVKGTVGVLSLLLGRLSLFLGVRHFGELVLLYYCLKVCRCIVVSWWLFVWIGVMLDLIAH